VTNDDKKIVIASAACLFQDGRDYGRIWTGLVLDLGDVLYAAGLQKRGYFRSMRDGPLDMAHRARTALGADYRSMKAKKRCSLNILFSTRRNAQFAGSPKHCAAARIDAPSHTLTLAGLGRGLFAAVKARSVPPRDPQFSGAAHCCE